MHPSLLTVKPELDILLWGATSSTGRLVAERLARHYLPTQETEAPALRWGLGGRSREKLEAIRQELQQINPRAAELPIWIGDAMDPASLDALVPRARVVVSTVGPYALYGRALVAACARHGVDYADLTGEIPFIRDMIDAHHAQAEASGARIIPGCGYDSIPLDLGTWMLHAHMQQVHGGRLQSVKGVVTRARGGVGGGTIASALHLVKEAGKNPAVRRALLDPYSLAPGDQGQDGTEQLGVAWDADLGGWMGPSVMANTNTRVVRRSNFLLNHAYGTDFRCVEVMGFSSGLWGLGKALGVAVAQSLGGAALLFPPTRALLAQVLPKPGDAPSRATQERGYFTIRLLGRGIAASGAEVRLEGEVIGTGDPGHRETSKMLSEAAVCLALEPSLPARGGLLTPAVALGTPLLERLRGREMVFRVWESGRA